MSFIQADFPTFDSGWVKITRHETWNPLTGCDRVSPGCSHCYAAIRAAQLKAQGDSHYQTDGDARTSGPGFGLALHPDRLDKPLHWREPRTIFINSMSDLFHKDVPLDFIARVFDVVQRTPRHCYTVFTKRAKRMAEVAMLLPWPQNLWPVVTVETQPYAFRINHLRQVPALVRAVSAEPFLGPLELDLEGVHWVMAGGETEEGHRPLNPDWVRSLRDQCVAAGVAFSFHQWGGLKPTWDSPQLDGRSWSQRPYIWQPGEGLFAQPMPEGPRPYG